MQRHLALTSLLVKDYDEAIEFFVNKLDFALIEDSPTNQSADPKESKRWVVVAPPGAKESALLLAEASTDAQRLRIGDQTGGRVFLFLHTDDFWRDYNLFQSRGVEFVRGAPREEAYGTVAVFSDIAGNLWDLIEPKVPS